jgi:hypothetical protein
MTSSALRNALKSVVSDAPALAFGRIRSKINAADFKPSDVFQLGNVLDPTASTQLPPGLQDVLNSAEGTVTNDKLNFKVSATGEEIPLNEVELYLYGDPTTGTFPRVADFYRKLGAKADVLENVQFQAKVRDLNANFVATKAYQEFLREKQVLRYGNEFDRKYGDTPEAIERYIQDHPEYMLRYIDELKKRNPEVKLKLESDPQLSQSVDKLSDAVQNKRTKYYVGAAVLGLAALGTWLYLHVEEARKRENGCRIQHRTEGLQGKVELLTCDDALIDASQDSGSEVRVVPTCATQNYPVQTMVACTAETFNPCLSDAKSRAEQASIPLVPDVCDKYAYRKTLGAKDTSGATQKVNACAVTSKDNACSKDYCDASKFAMFKNQPDLKLKCVNLTWGQALVNEVIKWGKDIFCTVVPFCNEDGPPIFPNWYKYIIGIVIGLIVLYVGFRLYRKFVSGGQPTGGGGIESLSFRERQRLLERLG